MKLRSGSEKDVFRLIWFAIASVTLFVSNLIIIIAGATIFAVGGYTHLSPVAFSILALVIGVPAVWACGKVAVLAFQAETDSDNHRVM